jgi:tRNA threonylcarbamoyladenosine biosynthesis protein TsaB
MRVLAIDTALAACSVAVFDTVRDGVIGGVVASESLPMVRGHAEALMPLVAQVMRTAETSFRQLDRIVVTTGPGSFTGMRVGIAAARGLGLATKLPVIGVSTLSAYAAPYLGADDTTSVIAAIDARHSHVYLQVFAPGGRTLIAPRLAPLSDAVRAAANSPACLVGSAALVVAEALPQGAPAPVTVDARDAPDIAWVAQLGTVVTETQAPPKPQYLRAPDAQPQNASQLPRR